MGALDLARTDGQACRQSAFVIQELRAIGLHFRRCRKGSYLRPATALGEDLLFRFPQSRVPEEVFFLPVHPWLSVVFQFFFILLAAGPTLQNLIPHLPQFFDDPSLGFGGFLDNAEHRLNLGLQLGVFLQSFFKGPMFGPWQSVHFEGACL